MEARFWYLKHLSDQQLLERLQGVLQTKRRALAELIAHLGEVEERRLHLQAACSSLFSYCVQRLGMSEDEACRRIEVARLARRFPALFTELASGGITLSVALSLKRMLSVDNQRELLAAVLGASTERAREILAARFPSPDVPSGIRKLPERPSPQSQPASAASAPAPASIVAPMALLAPLSQPVPSSQPLPALPQPAAPSVVCEPPSSELRSSELSSHEVESSLPAQSGANRRPERSPSGLQQRIEPLSAGRYRVQFTADAGLKHKLEQARDLLRHAQPNGDLGAIVSRALDCLLEELMRRRFGTLRKERVAKRATAPAATPPAATRASVPPATPPVATRASVPPATPPVAMRAPAATPPAVAPAPVAAATSVTAPAATPAPVTAAPAAIAATRTATAPRPTAPDVGPRVPSQVARAARRAVLERDGLGCSWVDAQGQRCGSTAWLELDHCHPAGKGGGAEPENLRMLCRAHNRFAAERAHGRAHVERAIRARQCSPSPQRPC